MNEPSSAPVSASPHATGRSSTATALLLVGALIAAVGSFGIQKTLGSIFLPDQKVMNLGAGMAPESIPPDILIKMDTELLRVDRLNAALMTTYTMGILGLVLMLASGTGGRGLVSWLICVLLGTVIAAALGGGAGWIGESLLQHWRATEGVVTIPHLMLSHVAATATAGVGVGLAMALATQGSDRRTQSLVGAVLGGALGGVVFVLIAALALPGAQIDRLVASDQVIMMIWFAAVALTLAGCVILVSSMKNAPPKGATA